MASTKVKEWVCTALEMEEKGRQLFQKALEGCPEAMGRDVFTMLRDGGAEHKARIEEIYRSLEKGAAMERVCTLQEGREADAKALLRKLVDEYRTDNLVCHDTLRALQMGIDFELALIKFYEDALRTAVCKEEKRFLHRMVQEKRGHYILLSDLIYYFEDPEGWAYKEDNPGLDGA